MEQLLSGSIGNHLLESGSLAIGALVRMRHIGDVGLITSQIDSGSYFDSRFWVYRFSQGKPIFFGTYLEALELLQFNTGSTLV
jgi:hypothetical protein